MQYTSIKISGFENIQLVTFSLVKEVNAHSVCEFSFNIPPEESGDYLDCFGNDIKISNGEDYIFYGVIDGVSLSSNIYSDVISIHAVSDSVKSDSVKKKRLFQDPDKTLDDVVSYLKKEGSFEVENKCGDIISIPLLQDGDTDFYFLKKLAHAHQLHLFIDDTVGQGKVKFIMTAANNGAAQKVEETPCGVSYKKNQSLNGGLRSDMIIVLRDTYYNTAGRISYNGFTGHISGLRMYMEKFGVYYEYTVVSDDSPPDYDIPLLPERVILSGIVAENDNSEPSPKGMLKVTFDCDYIDAAPEKKMWIPYRTPYSASKGGFVFIPDKDDRVQVIYSRGKLIAEECFEIGDIPEEMKEFRNKYISNIYNKRLTFAEDSLEICSDENTVILTKETVTFTVGGCSIVIKDGSVELDTGETSVIINSDITVKTGKLKIETGGETALNSDGSVKVKATEIKSETDNDISLKAGKNIKINGSNIYLK